MHHVESFGEPPLLGAPALEAAILVDDEEPVVGSGHAVPGGEHVEFVLGELGAVGGCFRQNSVFRSGPVSDPNPSASI